MEYDVVWLTEERKFAFLIQRNAFFSIVRYIEAGIEFEVLVENDDYDLWEERAIEYESD